MTDVIAHPDAIHSSVSGAPAVTPILNNSPYTFTAGGVTSTVYNENVFKNDPGIGGLVLTKRR